MVSIGKLISSREACSKHLHRCNRGGIRIVIACLSQGNWDHNDAIIFTSQV